jgi:hypothetical protein
LKTAGEKNEMPKEKEQKTCVPTPVFHVWDFSDRIEVRLSNDLIEKLRGFKEAKASTFIHYKSRKEITIVKHYSVFPVATAIGQRLFEKRCLRHGKEKVHMSFVTVPMLREIQRRTGLSPDELEAGVTHVRTCSGTKIRLCMSFPIEANSDWAFMFGLWFAAGGKITRRRKGRCEEYTLRFSLDARPFRELVVPVLSRLGYWKDNLGLSELYYVKKGGHKLDAHIRREFAALPRGTFVVHRGIREIMEKMGLPKPEEQLSRLEGIKGKRGFRQVCRDQIPGWITENTEFMHVFVEAYLNGPSAASVFHADKASKRSLLRYVEPRFVGKDPAMCEGLYSLITEFLETEGIHGHKHNLPIKHKQSPAHELGYAIICDGDLRALNGKYKIVRSDVRARLLLHCNMTPLLYELCRRLSSFEILLVGAILEKPCSVPDLITDFRCDKVSVETSLNRLFKMGVFACAEGVYSFEPSKWVLTLGGETKTLLSQMRGLQGSLLQQCSSCYKVFTVTKERENCGVCGGKLDPIVRPKVLGPLNRQVKKLLELQPC